MPWFSVLRKRRPRPEAISDKTGLVHSIARHRWTCSARKSGRSGQSGKLRVTHDLGRSTSALPGQSFHQVQGGGDKTVASSSWAFRSNGFLFRFMLLTCVYHILSFYLCLFVVWCLKMFEMWSSWKVKNCRWVDLAPWRQHQDKASTSMKSAWPMGCSGTRNWGKWGNSWCLSNHQNRAKFQPIKKKNV